MQKIIPELRLLATLGQQMRRSKANDSVSQHDSVQTVDEQKSSRHSVDGEHSTTTAMYVQ